MESYSNLNDIAFNKKKRLLSLCLSINASMDLGHEETLGALESCINEPTQQSNEEFIQSFTGAMAKHAMQRRLMDLDNIRILTDTSLIDILYQLEIDGWKECNTGNDIDRIRQYRSMLDLLTQPIYPHVARLEKEARPYLIELSRYAEIHGRKDDLSLFFYEPDVLDMLTDSLAGGGPENTEPLSGPAQKDYLEALCIAMKRGDEMLEDDFYVSQAFMLELGKEQKERFCNIYLSAQKKNIPDYKEFLAYKLCDSNDEVSEKAFSVGHLPKDLIRYLNISPALQASPLSRYP